MPDHVTKCEKAFKFFQLMMFRNPLRKDENMPAGGEKALESRKAKNYF